MVSQSGRGFEQVDGIVFLNNNETKPETTPHQPVKWFLVVYGDQVSLLPIGRGFGEV